MVYLAYFYAIISIANRMSVLPLPNSGIGAAAYPAKAFSVFCRFSRLAKPFRSGNPTNTRLQSVWPNTGHPASLSHNLLVAAGLQQVNEPIVLPVSGLKMQRAHRVKQAVFGAESGWSVLPNPASDYLLVTQPLNPQPALAEYELVDPAGRLVQAGVLPAKASCRLQIGSLQTGYYVARFSRLGQLVYQVTILIQP